jgi:hypothetical protein
MSRLFNIGRHHCDAAYFAECEALRSLDSISAASWASVGDAITDIEHACGMTARARVEQVRAIVCLLSWGLS